MVNKVEWVTDNSTNTASLPVCLLLSMTVFQHKHRPLQKG